MKNIDLVFRSNINGGLRHLKLTDVKSDLDAQTVKNMMQQIIDAKIFVDKNAELLYAKPVSAVYIDEQDHVLFEEK
ncbi:DUF2922 domain-containing protein [Ligilactobacillus acidipiscis]|uniref:DUF2922 domain-containing protein n=1 Tax=Ligilactobacillus acidipiscis TaxID=89059 RepID=A0A0R2K7N9_9LACO|nr:DUF2922 domain-containing protein [Ligilactobacillus acidipiscis]KRN82618.1 hypothetical protein IV43_GL001566 [Ligilactobacillus acidipiscis]